MFKCGGTEGVTHQRILTRMSGIWFSLFLWFYLLEQVPFIFLVDGSIRLHASKFKMYFRTSSACCVCCACCLHCVVYYIMYVTIVFLTIFHYDKNNDMRYDCIYLSKPKAKVRYEELH